MSKKKKAATETLLKQDDILQAVVLADSFNVRFAPITLEKPRTLLPLVNRPLLDYTLEFLVSAGVQDIYVYCTSHPEQIQNHIKTCPWQCHVTTVVSEDCRTVGDALRDIDNKELIKSDFILVNGDVISNMSLKKVLDEHKARRLKDKSAVMTLVLKEACPAHKTRCQEDEFMIAVDNKTNRVLHYQKIHKSNKVTLSMSMFENNDIELRYDLLDCHIGICSPQVLQLFTDNFDYQTKDDFVHGILVNEEIMGNQIHLHLLHTEYAARVSNLYMYDAISKDVIHRWTYPFVVDNNLCVNESGYMLLRHNIYISKDITLARGCVLKEDVVVGQGTCIGTNTVISNSVIGRNCQIGENVILKNAYIWDNVVICGHCEIDSSLICNGSTVLSNVTIQPNCTISYNVTVGPDVNIKPGTLLTTQLPTLNTGFDDFATEKEIQELDDVSQQPPSYDVDIVGKQGKGYPWKLKSDDDEDIEEELCSHMWNLCVDTEQDEESSEDESIEDLTPPTTPPLDDTRMFYNEVLDSLHRGIEENINCDNLVLEINSSKYAYNVSMKELNGLVVKAILELPQLQSTLRPPQYLSALKTLLKQLSPVLQNYIKSCESQMDCLVALEEYCGSCENFAPIIMQVIHYMYDQMEILQESVILSWYNQTSSSDEPHTRMKHQEIRKQVTTFVKWLEEADEESDSDDDDDDSN